MSAPLAKVPVSESEQAYLVYSLNGCLAARPDLQSAAAYLAQAMLEDSFPNLGARLRHAAFIEFSLSKGGDVRVASRIVPLTQRIIECWQGKTPPPHALGSYLTLYPGAEYPEMLSSLLDRVDGWISEWAPLLLDAYKQRLVDFWSLPSPQGASPWQQLSAFIAAQLRRASAALSGDERATVQAVLDFPDLQERREQLGEGCTQAHIPIIDTRVQDPEPLRLQVLALTRWVGKRQIVLLYTLLGGIETFDSVDALETSLGRTLSGQDSDLRNYSPEYHLFDAMAVTLLTRQLESIGAIRPGDYSEAAALDRQLHELTGPQALVGAFRSGHEATLGRLHDLLPAWLRQASTVDRTTYGRYVTELAAVHRRHAGKAFLDGIPDVLSFAAQALSDSLLKRNPEAKGVSVGDIRVTLTRSANTSWELAAPGFVSSDVRTESVSLGYAAMALRNLGAFPRSTVTQVHYLGQAAPPWMTYEVLRTAVSDADIGKHYPELLRQKLQDDGPERARQQMLFTDYLRALLPMLALEMRLRQRLTETACLYLTAVVTQDSDTHPVQGETIVLRPLALVAHPGAVGHRVLNQFVIGPQASERGPQVLLRPGSPEPLLEFASFAHLLVAIQAEGELQQSVLAGLDSSTRPIYDLGGFLEPHLARMIISDWEVPDIPEPPSLDTAVLPGSAGAELFAASVEALIGQAEAVAVSNAQERWKRFTDLGWALFNLLVPLAPGPLVSVGLIVQLVSNLKSFADPNNLRPWAAFADVLLNLAAVLVYHRRLRIGLPASVGEAKPVQATVIIDDVVAATPVSGNGSQLAFIWSRKGRDFSVSELERLDSFKLGASTSHGRRMVDGEWSGLFQRDGLFYACIEDDWFRVSRKLEGVVIVDDRHPARQGPWLKRDAAGDWQLDRGPRLLGGVGELSVRARKKFNTLKRNANQLLDSLPGRLARGERDMRIVQGPADIETRLRNDAKLFSDLARTLQDLTAGLTEYPQALISKLEAGAKLLQAHGMSLRIARIKLDLPTVGGVSYLNGKQQIRIRPLGPRKDISPGKGRDFLQEYEIADLQRTPLWYAHFHYKSLTADASRFTKAHLKTPRQRFKGLNAQRAQAVSGKNVEAIWRAPIDPVSAAELFLPSTS